MTQTLQESTRQQREVLTDLLSIAMLKLAEKCAPVLDERAMLEQLLIAEQPVMKYCKHLYVLDRNMHQVTANITREGADESQFARDRTDRPYMQGIIGTTDFKLSEAYISRNKKRPSLTAIQVIRNADRERIGFLGADFDLRELPHTEGLYQEPAQWRQIKGDPAIRSGLFEQQRAESLMDQRIDDVLALMNELVTERGVFHGKFHFSSSRCSVWLVDDPYVYRILGIDELTPEVCLAYPRRPYTERSIVPPQSIMPIFQQFKTLRFCDENIYLRSGGLNICNGMVSLNFSCDGSHYMRFDEFLDKDSEFWFGPSGLL